jgi:limonene-1,2-epoxide hydrolase
MQKSTHNGKIMDWADYYDVLKSRRAALAAYFEDRGEL